MSLKILKIIHIALVLGLAAFAAVTFFSGPGFVNQFNVNDDVFIYIVPIIAVAGYFASKFLFNKELSNINSSDPLQQKLAIYQKASIIKYALIEGPALLAFFQFMNTGYTIYFTIGATLVILLAIQQPSRAKLIQELGLNSSEQKQLV